MLTLELKASPWVCVAAIALLISTAAAIVLTRTGVALTGVLLVALLALALRALPPLFHGYSRRALRRVTWLGENRWLLEDGAGRQEKSALHANSRRLGRTLLLVFHGTRHPWALVLPSMSDRDAGRRLRVRFSLDGGLYGEVLPEA
jgi:hypothetical protein